MAAKQQFKDLSDEQLVHQLLNRERDLVRARFSHSQQQLENTATLSRIRKDIARLKTEARTREIANGLMNGSLVAEHGKTFGQQAGEGAPAAAAAPERGGFLKGIVDRLTGRE